MTEPLDLAAFVHDALAPPKMTTETVKELTRSIAEATEDDAALLDEALAALNDARAELAWLFAQTNARKGGSVWKSLKRCEAVLASARRLGKGGGA